MVVVFFFSYFCLLQSLIFSIKQSIAHGKAIFIKYPLHSPYLVLAALNGEGSTFKKFIATINIKNKHITFTSCFLQFCYLEYDCETACRNM